MTQKIGFAKLNINSVGVNLHYLPFLLFIVLEVLFYGKWSLSQALLAYLEYFILGVLAVLNIRVAIAYFIAFSLLSFGSWSYVVEEIQPGNFWGLRVLGISINLIFSLFLSLVFLIKYQNLNLKKISKEFNFLLSFYGISTFIGLLYFFLNVNYLDNYLKDLMTFSPLLIYVYLMSGLEQESSTKIFTYGISATMFGMLLSLASGIFFEYGSGLKFILLNSFGFMVMFILPFCKEKFSKTHYFILIIISIVLLLSGKFFIGGKFIILAFLSFLWYFLVYKRNYLFIFFTLFLLFIISIFWEQITDFLLQTFEGNLIVQNKLSQVISIVNILDIELLSSTPTSVGNIIAEAQNITQYFFNVPIISFTGLGFGGGAPDLFGNLTPMAKPGMGYAEIDAVRNNFFRMHLPIFEFFLKIGIFGGAVYIYISMKKFLEKNIFSFYFFLVFFTVFTNNKEMILMGLFFLNLSLSENSFKN